MSVTIHTTKVYDVQYGSSLSIDVTDDIIDLIRNSETGYISEDEMADLEIDRDELEYLRAECTPKVQEAIDIILKESDTNNDFIHLSIF